MTAKNPTAVTDPLQRQARHPVLVGLVVFLFFAWGFSTVLIDTLIPKLRSLFELSYAEAMLTQFAFFLGYLVFSVPAGMLLARIGYLRAIITGLVTMCVGCLLFAPAASMGVYEGFLFALFVMAAGITILQVAANPLVAALGSIATSHSRLTLAQAFNSLGTTVGPFFGAALILGASLPDGPVSEQLRLAEAHTLHKPFVLIAGVLFILALVFWFMRRAPAPDTSGKSPNLAGAMRLLGRPRLGFGALSIFLYVGAEVSIGSVMTNYLMQPTVLSVTGDVAARILSLYWGGAMVGRFIGSFVLSRVTPGRVLMSCATGAALLAVISSASIGTTAAVAVVAIGLMNSIMFPTIFTLALEGLGDDMPKGSGLLCMAIVGGAIIPVITGGVADATSLATALLVPAVCYVWIAVYGAQERRWKA
ncbi:MAG: sugar MFS transporter [Nevskiaceae bacterium]|jgi:FHS family L-fucose permease-like MFS transporter|nr:sugar MFS transporter [Nevskiaceae bacterium]